LTDGTGIDMDSDAWNRTAAARSLRRTRLPLQRRGQRNRSPSRGRRLPADRYAYDSISRLSSLADR
jgi:hypothetical protein